MNQVDLIAVGDISFGDHYACASLGINSHLRANAGKNVFQDVSNFLGRAPIVFGNLETVLSENGLKPKNLASMHMRGSPRDVIQLVRAGFNVVNIANNHILQHGSEAFVETVELLRSNGIGVVGIAKSDGQHCQPFTATIRDTEVVFLGYGFEKDKYFFETTLYASANENAILEDVRELKREDNMVVCSFHWGNEFVPYPSMQQVRFGRKVMEAGCDLILGHHPHVLNGYEFWQGKPIFYSLGNFLFDQLWNGPCTEGCIVKLKMGAGRFELKEELITGIGDDFTLCCDGDPELGRNRFAELSRVLEHSIASAGADYDTDRVKLEARNRISSWWYLLRNSYRYDPTIIRQIIGNTLSKKFFQKSH